ncbi:DNA repair protein RecN [Gulosibacter bifidus]|uniref:DNA repair protein RecN n=1 Tax=Gulosibacter bifidus TaxID=272239 RepID=A0ABW5RF41_9MICO|nr:DNA repair protein RecN [Gulosibacter bifidus]
MLDDISIRGLGVIDEAVLPLGPGFTAITGETGAGKTMVVTALGLLLGGRASADAVRKGADRASVDGHIVVDRTHAVVDLVDECGGDTEPAGDEQAALIVSRQVQASGRSRAWLGGRPVPAGKLAEAGELLVAVHGQSEQLRLTQEHTQRDALDRFGGQPAADALARVGEQHARVRALADELDLLERTANERAQRRVALQELTDTMADVAPEPGEDTSLLARIERLSNREALRQDIGEAHAQLAGDAAQLGGAPLSMRDQARSISAAIARAQRNDASLEVISEAASDLEYTIDDLTTQLAGYLADLDTEGVGELELLNERLATIEDCKRKFQADSLDALLTATSDADRELLALGDDATRIPELRDELGQATTELQQAADALTAIRQAAAAELALRVDEELHALAMPHAAFTVSLETAEQVRAHGQDLVQFRLAPHPGTDPAPVGTSASGGELSRIMLALEVVLAAANPVPTLIFDEVDAGVGGAAALEIGARLQRLAQTSQVIVVTHLAQVAAFADHHVQISKSTDGEVTSSTITELDASGRVAEMTRLLSGLTESESGRAHAEELLARAGRAAAR